MSIKRALQIMPRGQVSKSLECITQHSTALTWFWWVAVPVISDSALASPGHRVRYLMNQSERHSQTIGNSSGSLRSSCIRTDDHGLLVYQRFEISISLCKVWIYKGLVEDWIGDMTWRTHCADQNPFEVIKRLRSMHLQFGILVWI